jgi:hypothetical protein
MRASIGLQRAQEHAFETNASRAMADVELGRAHGRSVVLGGTEVPHPARSENAVDAAVVRFERHNVKNFVIVDDGKHGLPGLHPSQCSVVRAAAAAEPMSAQIDRECRNQDHLGVGDRVECLARSQTRGTARPRAAARWCALGTRIRPRTQWQGRPRSARVRLRSNGCAGRALGGEGPFWRRRLPESSSPIPLRVRFDPYVAPE